MPRGKKRQSKAEEQHTHLSIRVEGYDANVEAAVNHHVYAPQYAWKPDDDDPLYEFTNRLRIVGRSTYPADRIGDTFEVTMYGDCAPSRRIDAKLRDAQARDERGALRFREYRGRRIPIYNPPSGLGLLQKVRGEARWTGWLRVAPRVVNDALVLLGHGKPLFMAVHERKDMRSRWVQGVRLQTNDPAEE
jgi:hypothetical protein